MKIVLFCGLLVLITLASNVFLFYLGGLKFTEAFLTGSFILLPLIINYSLVYWLKKPKSDFDFIVLSSLLGAFITNLVIAVGLIFMYAPEIMKTNSLGPAEGYWGLFTYGGAIQYSTIGIIVGAVLSSIYLKYKNGS